MHHPPEDICYLTMQRDHYIQHLERVRDAAPCTDTSKPYTFGLKHLDERGKKKQLERDRLNHIMKTDKMLNDTLTKIMMEDRSQPLHIGLSSLNEKSRVREIEKLNRNNRYMFEKLSKTGAAVTSREKMKADFEKHKQLSHNMSKKHFGVLPVKQSPIKRKKGSSVKDGSVTSSSSRVDTVKTAASENVDTDIIMTAAAYLKTVKHSPSVTFKESSPS
mmetsp:Transcript_12643/g.19073  ORF Transcript_12643/g.19073 Transcript_12643/m.19073 type:complete len:218 (+) Transcript_12643:87-740(+)